MRKVAVIAHRCNTRHRSGSTATSAFFGTLSTYVSRLLAKLDARDRSRLVIIAYESGLITPRQA